MFKLDQAGADRLFGGQRIFIKRGVDKATAERFREVFAKAGALAEIERVGGEPEEIFHFDDSEDAPAQSQAAGGQADQPRAVPGQASPAAAASGPANPSPASPSSPAAPNRAAQSPVDQAFGAQGRSPPSGASSAAPSVGSAPASSPAATPTSTPGAPASSPAAAPAGGAWSVAPPGAELEELSDRGPEQNPDTSKLSLVEGDNWSLEDCAPPPLAQPIPDIDSLELEQPSKPSDGSVSS